MSVKKKNSFNQIKSFNYPDRLRTSKEKLAIVCEIHKHEMTTAQAALKFHTSIATILRWRKQYTEEFLGGTIRTFHDEATKRSAVRDIEAGVLTLKEACVKYKILNTSTIKKWCTKYSSSFVNPAMQHEKMERVSEVIDQSPNADQISQLKNALAQAQLQINGLQTMIDLAEEQFDIDIRKKSGTKQ